MKVVASEDKDEREKKKKGLRHEALCVQIPPEGGGVPKILLH